MIKYVTCLSTNAKIKRLVILTDRVHQNGEPIEPPPDMFMFGLSERPPPPHPSNGAIEDGSHYRRRTTERQSPPPTAIPRKHPRESGSSNGVSHDSAPPSKRPRKSNGAVESKTEQSTSRRQSLAQIPHLQPNGNAPSPPPAKSTTNSPSADAMDMDTNGTHESGMHLDHAHAHAPEPQPPRTFTSVGTLTEKTAQLGTTTLDVAGAARVMQVAWNPADSAVLATTGEGICGIWNLARGQPHQFVDLLEDAQSKIVTASAWSGDGERFAVATYLEETVRDAADWSIWSKKGRLIENIAVQYSIAALRWHPDRSRLLGIGPEVVVWNMHSDVSLISFRPSDWIWDATWTTGDEFWLAGNAGIYRCSSRERSIVMEELYESDSVESQWNIIKQFPHSFRGALVVAASLATSTLWLPTLQIKASKLHDAEITSMEYSPHHYETTSSPSSLPLLATSSSDPTASVKIWKINTDEKRLENISTLSLGPMRPVMALSFTHDGFLLAAAGYDRILMWNPEQRDRFARKVVWKAEELDMVVWNGVKLAEEDEFGGDDVHSLSWDADNKKLAFGLGNQVCIFWIAI